MILPRVYREPMGRWVAVADLLVVLLLCGYLVSLVGGELTLNLKPVFEVGNLRNPIIFLALAAMGRGGIAYYRRRRSASSTTAGAGYLLEAIMAILALATGWYLLYGPFAITVPLGYRIGGFGDVGPLLILLMAFRLWIASPGAPGAIDAAREWIGRRRTGIAILLIGLFAILMRAWGLYGGLREWSFHVDTVGHIDAIHLFLRGYYQIGEGYPFFGMHFPEWVIRSVDWFYELTGFGYPASLQLDNRAVAAVTRTLNLAYTVVIIGLMWRIGERLERKSATLLAMALFACSLLSLQMARYVSNDYAMAMVGLAGIYLALLHRDDNRRSPHLAVGAVMAVAFAIKYNAILLYAVIALLYSSSGNLKTRIGRLLLTVAGFVTVFYLVSPQLWDDPLRQFDRIGQTIEANATHRGVIERGVGDSWLETHVEALVKGFPHHLWAVDGLFAPLPLPLALLGLIGAIGATGRRYKAFWLGPILAFLAGTFIKPNAGIYHFLVLVPLLLLSVSIGFEEIARRLPIGRVRGYAVAGLLLLTAYHAVEDSSFGNLRPLRGVNDQWVKENLADDPQMWDMVQGNIEFARFLDDPPRLDLSTTLRRVDIPDYRTDPTILTYFHNAMPHPITWWRDLFMFYRFREPYLPLLYPEPHFVAESPLEILYPTAHELVTTVRAFTTPGERPYPRPMSKMEVTEEMFVRPPHNARPPQVRRLIVAREATLPIAVWGRNCSDQPNVMYGSVGGEGFVVTLKPFETFLKTFDDPARSSLYYHRFFEVGVGSEQKGCWLVAASDEMRGDLFRLLDAPQRGAEAYLNDGSALSLLKAKALSLPLRDAGLAADTALKAKYPRIAALTEKDALATPWETMAGYPDRIFGQKMSRHVAFPHHTGSVVSGESLLLGEGGAAFGDYRPLLAGSYRADFSWSVTGATTSVTFDVVSRLGLRRLAQITLTGHQLAKGSVSLPFDIDDPMECDVELRIRDVRGGKLAVVGARIAADYRQTLARLLRDAETADNASR